MHGFHWKIGVAHDDLSKPHPSWRYRRISTDPNKRSIGVYIECCPEWLPSEATPWECRVSVEFELYVDNERAITLASSTMTGLYSNMDYDNGRLSNTLGLDHFWEFPATDLASLQGKTITVEAFVTKGGSYICRDRSLKRNRRMVVNGWPQLSTVSKIVVGGEQFFVSRELLARHSTYFARLFDSPEPKVFETFELDSLEPREFSEFLDMICLYEREVNSKNVCFLTKLAARFDTKIILNKCEEFLIYADETEVGFGKKLELCAYLPELKEYCIALLKTKKSLRSLIKSADYGKMDSSSKVSLLADILKHLKM